MNAMLRALKAFMVALIVLATSAAGTAAHPVLHCETEQVTAQDEGQGHGTHDALLRVASDLDAAFSPGEASPNDPALTECSQNLCAACAAVSADQANEWGALAVLSRIQDTGIPGLERPESLYRPPEV